MVRLQKILWLIVIILILLIIAKPDKKAKELPDGTYQNSYMMALKDEKMQVLIDGTYWTLSCPVGKKEEKSDKIVDITVKNNQIRKITWKEGGVEDKILAVNQEEQWMQLSGTGKVVMSSSAKLYIKDNDGIRMMTKAGSLLNWDKVNLYIHENQIEAIVASGEQNKQTIKVLLHGETDGIYHKEVRLTASENYVVTKNDEVKYYEQGQELQLKEETDTYQVECQNGKIRLLSTKRASGYPEYRGIIRIQHTEHGFLIVNELPLEEYLYGVVSSEMPSSYPQEALKTQAVCARTYALYQMEQAYYSAYGAHVDDTVNSQVYNNIAETAQSKEAVDDTKGQYLEYDNQAIPAYFYSTSCGTTSDVNDVWVKEEASPEYLRGHFQGMEEEMDGTNLSTEEKFKEFITAKVECFEQSEDWFRWKGTTTLKKLTSHINKNVKNGNIGDITNIEIAERSKGGVLKEIKITGKKGSLTVKGEYQIRKVLCPEKTKLTLNNGEKRTVDMLPSGYFAIECKKDNVVFSGGGYGHGVGMSQNGAKAMAELDHGYEDILLFYYPGTMLLERY